MIEIKEITTKIIFKKCKLFNLGEVIETKSIKDISLICRLNGANKEIIIPVEQDCRTNPSHWMAEITVEYTPRLDNSVYACLVDFLDVRVEYIQRHDTLYGNFKKALLNSDFKGSFDFNETEFIFQHYVSYFNQIKSLCEKAIYDAHKCGGWEK